MTKNKAIPLDNDTRWNSMAAMIEAALTPHVRQAINRWFNERPKDQCADERITDDDQEVIKKVYVHSFLIRQFADFWQYYSILSKITQTTKALESNTSTLDNVLPAIDYILTLFKKGKEEFKDNELMTTCINSGQAKMNKYYTRTGETPVYATAVILYPSFKWQYFKKVWDDQPSQVTDAQSQVKKLQEREFLFNILSLYISSYSNM